MAFNRFNYVVHAIRKKKKLSLGEFVRKNAPEYCEVSIVHQGNKVMVDEQIATSQRRPQCERSIYEWACFPGKFISTFSEEVYMQVAYIIL